MSKEKLNQEELKSLLKNDGVLQAVARAMNKAVTLDTYDFTPEDRSIFTAENLDPIVKTIVPTAAPIRSLLPRTPGQGEATAWKMLTSRLDPQSPPGTDTSIAFADATEPNETEQDYEVKSAAFKLLGRKVEVGMKHIAASQGYQSIEDELLRVKVLEVMLGEEDMIINGDTSNPLEFDGLLKQIETNVDAATTDLTVSGIAEQDEAIFNKGGVATHLFLNPKQSRKLSEEMQDTGSINRIVVDNQGAAAASLRVSSIISPVTGNTIQLVTSRYLGGNAILGSVQSPAGENWVEMEDLIPLVSMDVANTTFAKTKFVVESTVLKLIAEPYWAKYTNLNV